MTLPASKNVDGITTKVVATPNDKKATVNYFVNDNAWDEQANGDKKFGNDATITIKVTAENGSTETYTLKVTVLETSSGELQVTDAAKSVMKIEDQKLQILEDRKDNLTVKTLYGCLESSTNAVNDTIVIKDLGAALDTDDTTQVAAGMTVTYTQDGGSATTYTIEFVNSIT